MQHRQRIGEETVQVVEEQLAVDAHAAVFDTRRWRGVLRIADVRGEGVLLLQ